MASDLDSSDFHDSDFQATRSAAAGAARPPTRAEVEARVGDVQQEIAKLNQAREELERKRASLEESRRRRAEWDTSRQELLHGLTRAIGLLEEAEFAARRDAEQTAKTITGLRDALNKVQIIQESAWTAETVEMELTRALTTVENARQEWNAARLKFPVLTSSVPVAQPAPAPGATPNPFGPPAGDFLDLCKTGLALTWPIAAAILLLLLAILLRGK